MRGWRQVDRMIQRRIDEARESGDPEALRRAQQEGHETYTTGSGAIIGGAVGTFLIPIPGVGTVLGAAIGAFLGKKAAEE